MALLMVLNPLRDRSYFGDYNIIFLQVCGVRKHTQLKDKTSSLGGDERKITVVMKKPKKCAKSCHT